ncbi:hypothetical protein, partial [Bacillus cereus]|uniref:hypothetical protein n=1 Tax=Bacillus cereus TaxID=1396 RepID=UPI001C3F1E5A
RSITPYLSRIVYLFIQLNNIGFKAFLPMMLSASILTVPGAMSISYALCVAIYGYWIYFGH